MDSLVSNIKNIKVYDNCMFHMKDILKKYDEYLRKLMDLEPKKLKYFIQNLRNREIVNNQEAELEESFLVELFQLSQKTDSIDVTMRYFNTNDLNKNDIKKIHRIVIKGSSDDLQENYDYRQHNNLWVGCYGTGGDKVIDYIPPKYEELNELLDEVLLYLNEKNDNIDNLFIKPLIVHALIAYIQPFGNGNTRLARVLQHCKICHTTNEIFNTNFTHPTLYLSKNYFLTRSQYRGLIRYIATEKNNNAWNSWFKYNLNMIDEQLFFLDKQLTQYKKI